MTNPVLVAQAEGFIRRHLEFDVEEGKPAGPEALEWFEIIEAALKEYRNEIARLQLKISGAKIALG